MYPLPLKQEERSLPATAEEDRTQHRLHAILEVFLMTMTIKKISITVR